MGDHNVKLPEQVKKQEKEADELLKKQQQEGKTDEELAALEEEKGAKEEEEKRLADELAEKERIEAEEAERLKFEEGDPENWKHKYEVLKGKYDAEVPPLTNEVRRLRDHGNELGEIIGTLQAEVEKLKTEKPTEKVDASSFLNPEELEAIEDVIEPSILNKVVDGLLAERLKTIEQKVTGVQNTQFQTAEDVFWGKVEQIENWETINTSPEFNAFLDLKAPYTNLTRRQILAGAQKRLDAATVIELFGDFVKTQKPTTPEGTTTLGRQPRISPPAGSSGTGAGAGKKIWTRKQISEFYQDVHKGKYKGREKERKRIDSDIWQAQIDGRIKKT